MSTRCNWSSRCSCRRSLCDIARCRTRSPVCPPRRNVGTEGRRAARACRCSTRRCARRSSSRRRSAARASRLCTRNSTSRRRWGVRPIKRRRTYTRSRGSRVLRTRPSYYCRRTIRLTSSGRPWILTVPTSCRTTSSCWRN